MARTKMPLQVGDATTAAQVSAGLKAARAQCPEPSVITQAPGYHECVIPRERMVWAQFYPKALPAHDAFANRMSSLDREIRANKISISDYINATQSARADEVASIQVTSTVRPDLGDAGGNQPAATSGSEAIDPAVTCMLMSSVIGIFSGVITHRSVTGLNSATAFLKGCTGQ
jgi:hypothetical protein